MYLPSNVHSLPKDVLRYVAENLSDSDKLRLAGASPVFREALASVVEVHLAEVSRSYAGLSDRTVRTAANLGYRTTYHRVGEEVTDPEVQRVSRLAFKVLVLDRCAVERPVLDGGSVADDLRLLFCEKLARLDPSPLQRLENLAVENCSSLTDLQLSGCNRLKSLALRSCYKLTLENVDFSRLVSLRALYLEDLPLVTSLDLTQLRNLERVVLVNCPHLNRASLRVPPGFKARFYHDAGDTPQRVELVRLRSKL